MADTSVAITAGSGTEIDTRTEATNGNHRQVVVLGDPSTNAGVAPVDATNGVAVDNKTLPPGAATSAKQDTQTTAQQAIQTSVELIDDAIKADDAAFTPATTKVMMAGFEYDDTSPDSVDEGDAGAARMSANRNVYTTIRDAAGNERGVNVNASNQLAIAGPVTNAGTFAVQDSEKVADNAGFTDGTTKVMPSGYIYDEVAGTALTENDVAAARINVNRAQVGTLEDGTTRGRYATVTASNALKVDNSAVTQPVSGTFWQATQPVSLASGATAIAKAEDVASADADVGVPAMAIRKAAPANTSGTDGDYEMVQMANGRQWVWAQPNIKTISTTITRPGDTNAYAANDVFANSTSAPTSGGFTFTGAALVSGGSGIIKDCIVSSSLATNYAGEIWIFDQSVTAKNDNAAFDVSDTDVQNLVGIIPFQTSDTTSSNAVSYITGLDLPYTCSGSADLRFLVKIMTAVTPGNAEVLAIRIKVTN